MEKIYAFFQKCIRWVYPSVCPFCREIHQGGICQDCREKIPYAEGNVCRKCGKPLADDTAEYCFDCRKQEHTFACGRSLYVHVPPVSDAVYRLKYHSERVAGTYFGREMAARYGDWIARQGIDVIVPVPLHKKRRKRRGYNQAAIVARQLAACTHIPYTEELVFRERKTARQKCLDPGQRKRNLRQAFVVSRPLTHPYRILVIDDIYTTGSTLDAVARVLKSAGAGKVCFLTISIGQGF